MSAIRYWVRAARRRHWVGIVVLAVLAGLGLGLASVAFTGARRADTAYDRLRSETLAPDALIGQADAPDDVLAAVAEDPSVTALGRFAFVAVAPEPLVPGVTGGAFVALDDAMFVTVYRPLAIEGRLARPEATDEVVVNEAMADAGGFEVGQSVTLTAGFEDPQPIGEATVVGVTRGIFDVGANTGNPSMLLSSAFLEAYPDTVEPGGSPVLLARLADGTDGVDEFSAAASAAAGTDVVAGSADDEAIAVERALSVQTIALGVLGLIAGLATLAAAVQALGRLLDASLAEVPVLVELGVRPGQGARLGVLLAIPVIALSPLVAIGVTLAGTPRVPTGFARTVDPSVGTHLDPVVLVGLTAAWVLVMVAEAALAGRRAGRGSRAGVEPVRAVTGSLPLRARLGSQAALAPVRARAGAAARSALVAGVVTVAGVVAVATFTASLDRLRDDLTLAGWDFDAVLSGFEPNLDDFRATMSDVGDLEGEPGVAAVSWVSIVEVAVEGGDAPMALESYAFDPDAGAVYPTLRTGRPPLSDDEVAVGLDVLRGRGLHLGDQLTLSGTEGRADLEIVGVGPFPELGNSGDLSTSASLTRATAQRIGATEVGAAALVQLEPGTDASVLEAYRGPAEVIEPFESGRVRNLGEVGATPTVLAVFLAALGLTAVLHSLLRSLRARRHDLAVLTAVGFRRRDLLAISGWQAVTAAAVSLVLGIPLGIAIGRLAWSATAAATGVVEVIVVPGLIILAMGVTTLLAWTIAARLIARLVVRGPAAIALRAD